MSIDQGIHFLHQNGLNIFLSTKVNLLPPEIFPFSEDQKNKTLVLIGAGGKTLWSKLDLSKPDPFDTFTLNQMNWFGKTILHQEIEIIFPHENVILPLQKLSRYFNFSHQSPIGIDISEEFGLWFSYRGIFLIEGDFPEIKFESTKSICEACIERPCLLVTDILNARIKCPIKNQYQYSYEQMEYHKSVISKL